MYGIAVSRELNFGKRWPMMSCSTQTRHAGHHALLSSDYQWVRRMFATYGVEKS